MTEEQLKKKNKQELVQICKDNNIVHYRGKNVFKKDELIEAICTYYKTEGSAEDKRKKQNGVETEENKYEHSNEPKKERVANAPIGTLIAFYEPGTMKLNTAKIINRNKSRKCIKCETQYGREFIISYENVIWVKTGTRWPKGIYELLKGRHINA